jgi:hypothetical protein
MAHTHSVGKDLLAFCKPFYYNATCPFVKKKFRIDSAAKPKVSPQESLFLDFRSTYP